MRNPLASANALVNANGFAQHRPWRAGRFREIGACQTGCEKCQRTMASMCGMIPSGIAAASRMTTGPSISGSASRGDEGAMIRARSRRPSGRSGSGGRSPCRVARNRGGSAPHGRRRPRSSPVSSPTSRAMLASMSTCPSRKIARLEGAGGEIDLARIGRMRAPCGSPPAHCRSTPARHGQRRARPPTRRRSRASTEASRSARRWQSADQPARRGRPRPATAAPLRRRTAPGCAAISACQFSSIASALLDRRRDAAPGRAARRHCSTGHDAPRGMSKVKSRSPSGDVERHGDRAVVRRLRPVPADARIALATPGRAARWCETAGRRARCRAPPSPFRRASAGDRRM